MPALSWSPPSMVTLLHPRGSPGEDTHCVVPILETQAPRIRGLEELAPSLVRGGGTGSRPVSHPTSGLQGAPATLQAMLGLRSPCLSKDS